MRGLPGCEQPLLRARRAGDEDRVRRQNRANDGERPGIARHNERKSRFRPDQRGNAVKAKVIWGRSSRIDKSK